MRVPGTEFWTYKLCDLENNVIVPLFHDKLNEYSVDWIALSSDMTNATVSINKGEQRFVFDGEKINEVETGLDLVYNDVSDNYNISRVESDEGVYVAIYKLEEEILIYKMGK